MAADIMTFTFASILSFSFFFWWCLGGPGIKVVKKKIDLSKLPDEQLRKITTPEKYFAIKEIMAIEKMGKEFKNLVVYFNDKIENNEIKAKYAFLVKMVIVKQDNEMDSLLERWEFCNKHLRKVKKFLKSHTYNQAVVHLINPTLGYYLMKFLQKVKDNIENGKVPFSEGDGTQIAKEVDTFLKSIVTSS